MSPQTIANAVVREVPLLRTRDEVGDAARTIVEANVPALPVVGDDSRLYGIFGEREFITALFPGYLRELSTARFVPDSIEDVINKRIECHRDPVEKYTNREQIAAGPGHSDTQLAETFLHHRVLIIPVVDRSHQVTGIVTRWDFFKALVERFTERSP